jgi:hypothetical protein
VAQDAGGSCPAGARAHHDPVKIVIATRGPRPDRSVRRLVRRAGSFRVAGAAVRRRVVGTAHAVRHALVRCGRQTSVIAGTIVRRSRYPLHIVRGDGVRLFPKERCLPLAELVAEQLGVVDHHSVERPIELLGVDSARTPDKPHTPNNPQNSQRMDLPPKRRYGPGRFIVGCDRPRCLLTWGGLF